MTPTRSAPPYDTELLDRLLGIERLDGLIVSSPHNVEHVTGLDRFFLYALADSVGLSRYVPLVALREGRSEDAVYAGMGNEAWALDLRPPWMADVRQSAWSAADIAREVASAVAGWGAERVGVELPYLPAEAWLQLRRALPDVTLVEATPLLEDLRAVKRPDELERIRTGSCDVVDAMLATFGGIRGGDTKHEVAERLRREETARGLTFDYCLIAAGDEANRAPAPRRLAVGDLVSLDSGAHRDGFVADLARMGVVGAPTAEQVEALAQVDAVQQAVRAQVIAGRRGGDLFEVARAAIEGLEDAAHVSFLAHGCGRVTHEAPRLTADGSPPYPAAHADEALRAGMVVSVETHLARPGLGFVKLEDTLLVRADGAEAVGDQGRGLNQIELA